MLRQINQEILKALKKLEQEGLQELQEGFFLQAALLCISLSVYIYINKCNIMKYPLRKRLKYVTWNNLP